MDQELHTLALKLSQALTARGWMMATAESCTGGWVAQALTSLSGSSTWFERGVVTYSNESKQALLGVAAGTLNRFGAVSEETAGEMAVGLLARSPVQAVLSVTGIAGPTGGSVEKPVGMVCFGWAVQGAPLATSTLHFSGDREHIRRQAVIAALEGLAGRLSG